MTFQRGKAVAARTDTRSSEALRSKCIRFSLHKLMDMVDFYFVKPAQITVEHVVLKGTNDSDEVAEKGTLLRGKNVTVNLIPTTAPTSIPTRSCEMADVLRFQGSGRQV